MPPRPFSYLNAEQGVALKDQLIQVSLTANGAVAVSLAASFKEDL
jgi:hypothetical protein